MRWPGQKDTSQVCVRGHKRTPERTNKRGDCLDCANERRRGPAPTEDAPRLSDAEVARLRRAVGACVECGWAPGTYPGHKRSCKGKKGK